MASSSDSSDDEADRAGDRSFDDSDSEDDKFVDAEVSRFEEMAKMYGAVDSKGRRSMPRLLVAMLVFMGGLYINNVSQAWLQKHIAGYYETHWQPVAPMNRTVILWDVSFELLPYVKSTAVADAFAIAAPCLVMLRFVVMPGPMSLRWTILSRIFIIWGLLFAFRAFTIVTTPLPNPDATCKPRISFPDNIWLEALANTPLMPTHRELTCQDVMYSGHTVAITLSALFLFKYIPVSPWTQLGASHALCSISSVINVVGAGCVVLGYYFIVASHFHYTVDVLVGAMATILFFVAYHHQARVIWLRKHAKQSRNPINAFLSWMEYNSLDLKAWRARARKGLEASIHHDVLYA